MAVQEPGILRRLNNNQMSENTNCVSSDEPHSPAFCSGDRSFVCGGFLAESQGRGGVAGEVTLSSLGRMDRTITNVRGKSGRLGYLFSTYTQNISIGSVHSGKISLENTHSMCSLYLVVTHCLPITYRIYAFTYFPILTLWPGACICKNKMVA